MDEQLNYIKMVEDILITLNSAEQQVITNGPVSEWINYANLWALCFSPKMRFGVHMDHNSILKNICVRLEFTFNEVREIEATALRKLAHPSRSNKLKNILALLREE